MYDAKHAEMPFHDGAGNWAKERSRDFPYHYRDGVTIWVAPVDVNPDDDFLA